MPASRDELRVAAVFLAALLGVHQLRYALAFGGDAGAALAQHGHGYLAWVTPAVAALGALAVGRLLVRAASVPTPAGGRAARVTRVWPRAAIALFSVYAGQELIEGALTSGHPDLWAGVMGNGGWLAVPLAVAFGAIVGLALRLSDAVEARLRGRLTGLWRVLPRVPLRMPTVAPEISRPRSSVLARHLAGRGPPFSV